MNPRSDELTCLPFELLVGSKTLSGYPLTVVESPAGEREALCVLEAGDELLDALQAVQEGDTDEDFLAELGAFLFDELFVGEVESLYRSSLAMAQSQGKRLRLRLRFSPSELAELP